MCGASICSPWVWRGTCTNPLDALLDVIADGRLYASHPSFALMKVRNSHQGNAAQNHARVQNRGRSLGGIGVNLDPINGIEYTLHGCGGCHAAAPSEWATVLIGTARCRETP